MPKTDLVTCAPEQSCKCCGATAALFGVVDFSKNCRELDGFFLPVSGIPIYYYRCPACDFIFTTFFDDFTDEDMKAHIYNDDYLEIDPGWQEGRAQSGANMLMHNFGRHQEKLSILDYGCGSGQLAERLLKKGFPRVRSFDPYVAEFSTPPEGRFNLVICFEVFEHLTDPARACREIVEFLTDDGIVVHSTMLQPKEIDNVKLAWWYVGPRNGHVSIFSPKSLEILWRQVGMSVVSVNQEFHIAARMIPDFAAHIMKTAGPK